MHASHQATMTVGSLVSCFWEQRCSSTHNLMVYRYRARPRWGLKAAFKNFSDMKTAMWKQMGSERTAKYPLSPMALMAFLSHTIVSMQHSTSKMLSFESLTTPQVQHCSPCMEVVSRQKIAPSLIRYAEGRAVGIFSLSGLRKPTGCTGTLSVQSTRTCLHSWKVARAKTCGKK